MLRFFRRRKYPKTREFDPEADARDWAIVHMNNEATGERGLVRIRRSRPPYVDTSEFDKAVSVRWSYDSPSLPDSDLNEQMHGLERAIDELTADNGYSELVQVKTGFGEREWLFYVSSQDRFMARFNALLAGHAAYPVEITFYADPEWKIWNETLEPIIARENEGS